MKLSELTSSMKSSGGKALVPFFTAGYPDEETFMRLLSAACESGCRLIEIGVPFSDPIADGPAIQESSRRALENGMSLGRTLELIERASKSFEATGKTTRDTTAQGAGAALTRATGPRTTTSSAPALVLMGYINPILRMGTGRFADLARKAGVSSVIIPDVPFEESFEIRDAMESAEISFIDFIAPTTRDDRVKRIARAARGFLYLVSIAGVTGVRALVPEYLGGFADRVRLETDVPLYVGFGISGPGQAGRAARYTDGVILGSALVRLLQSSGSGDEAVERVRMFLRDVKSAIDDHKEDQGRKMPRLTGEQRR